MELKELYYYSFEISHGSVFNRLLGLDGNKRKQQQYITCGRKIYMCAFTAKIDSCVCDLVIVLTIVKNALHFTSFVSFFFLFVGNCSSIQTHSQTKQFVLVSSILSIITLLFFCFLFSLLRFNQCCSSDNVCSVASISAALIPLCLLYLCLLFLNL